MVSVPVVSPPDFLAAKQRAKLQLQEDRRLDKAASLTAQRDALLANPAIPADLKVAQLKALNRQVTYWTNRVRRPFGQDPTGPGDPNEDADDAGPTQAMVNALIKTIKKPATPVAAVAPSPHVGKFKQQKRRPWDYLTPQPTPPTRPAKQAAKRKLHELARDEQLPSTSRRRLPQTPLPKTPTGTPSAGGTPTRIPRRLVDGVKSKAKAKAKDYAADAAKKGAKSLAKSWLKL